MFAALLVDGINTIDLILNALCSLFLYLCKKDHNNMFRDKKLLKAGLSQFSRKELEDMVIKLAGKRHNFEFLLINYFDREGGEQWLFGEALDGLERIFEKEYKGRSVQHREVKRLNASAKLIKEFAVEVKNKKYEADLMLHVLQREFAFPDEMFGVGFSSFDYKLALWVKKLLQILTEKIHPDYLVDYQDELNRMLQKLHRRSYRINTVKLLPKEI